MESNEVEKTLLGFFKFLALKKDISKIHIVDKSGTYLPSEKIKTLLKEYLNETTSI